MIYLVSRLPGSEKGASTSLSVASKPVLKFKVTCPVESLFAARSGRGEVLLVSERKAADAIPPAPPSVD